MSLTHLKQSQIATSTFPYCRYSLDYTLDSLERIGCEHFEFQAVEPLLSLEDVSEADIRVTAKKIADHHLKCICVTPDVMNYPINLASSNEMCRRRSIGILKRAVNCAEAFHAPFIQMHVGYSLIDEPAAEAWERAAESMRELAGYAAAHGIVITSEYSVFTWKSVLQSSKALRKLIDEVDSPGYKGMTDTVVMVKIPETIEDSVNNIGIQNLRHVHFTDGLGDATSSLHMVPGEGRLPLDHILQVLDDAKYDGYLSLELQGADEAPEEAMRKGYKWMCGHIPG
ncbi:sugar phosphate isomerase/epimerase [Lacrimispora sp. NSJ-141]|uniref:Sugar phosphate isomerase/epimerase n=1 Tax=Lientehia hominis TaxID=2897778 RepID=A0AAP2RI54_9FIRM|nr:sugar phosphate isomerase/epimerase family protein [Lientehia hominis]MCD2492171.1 sugar phosphate isomerase/epimerase [Lientehia hominis]